MAVISEVYLDAVEAFTLLRDMIGVDIIYRSRLQKCVTANIRDVSDWQQVGFIEQSTTHVDMLEDDLNDFVLSGFDEDQQPTITLDTDVEYRVVEIDRNPATPVVRLHLSKEK